MKILMFAVNDPAGSAVSFTNAINGLSADVCRLITLEIRYNFNFEKDLHLPHLKREDLDEVEHLLKTSDVFHFHMTFDENVPIGPFLPKDYIKGKLIVHHHHGHPDYRSNPQKYIHKYRELGRRNILVSTPDLLRLFPDAVWQPNLIPIHRTAYLPFEGKKMDTFGICQSPTRNDLKNTDILLRVITDLKTGFGNLSFDLIENTEHRECLRRKRRCHVLFDHMQGYYGISSLEGLSQGLAVIAGIDDWNRRHLLEYSRADELPWVIAHDEESLRFSLTELISDPEMSLEIGRKSRRFMEKYWTEERILESLLEFYANLKSC